MILSGDSKTLEAIQNLDGMSLKSWILEPEKPKERDALYWHYPHYGNQVGNPGSVIHERDWKLIYFYETQKMELYNLKEDIGERNNLVAVDPGKVVSLKTKLLDWLVETKAGFSRPNEVK